MIVMNAVAKDRVRRMILIVAAFVMAFASLLPMAMNADAAGPYTATPVSDPDRTIITDGNGWVATFTNGTRTVNIRGPIRSFTEPSLTSATFSTNVYVYVMPLAYDGSFDMEDVVFVDDRVDQPLVDGIAISMQYIEGAPTVNDANNRLFSSNADYGPLVDGVRKEGADFNDYVRISWNDPLGGPVDTPEADEYGSLDCSGYLRMIWGYRMGMSTTPGGDGQGIHIPRRSFQILASAPGQVIVPNAGTQVVDFTRMQPGDIVFFDADSDDGPQIDHVGMYLGKDSQNNHRFISSRKTINGPTFGTDGNGQGGRSTLNGASSSTGKPYYWAAAFRAVRRF